MQPKVLLRDAAIPLARATERGATHIVKSFDPREYPELAANEYFCMHAARGAGIATPHVQLSATAAFSSSNASTAPRTART